VFGSSTVPWPNTASLLVKLTSCEAPDAPAVVRFNVAALALIEKNKVIKKKHRFFHKSLLWGFDLLIDLSNATRPS
jgi:hypothetical protein